jgi:hypothetical protein
MPMTLHRDTRAHWHGAAADQQAHFLQTTIGAPGTYWMEEVGRDDYPR